jgi:hypothetical protein
MVGDRIILGGARIAFSSSAENSFLNCLNSGFTVIEPASPEVIGL